MLEPFSNITINAPEPQSAQGSFVLAGMTATITSKFGIRPTINTVPHEPSDKGLVRSVQAEINVVGDFDDGARQAQHLSKIVRAPVSFEFNQIPVTVEPSDDLTHIRDTYLGAYNIEGNLARTAATALDNRSPISGSTGPTGAG